MFSTVLSNNNLSSMPFIILLVFQFLFYLLIYVFIRSNKTRKYINSFFFSDILLIENSVLLIPLLLTATLIVNSSYKNVEPVYVYAYVGLSVAFFIIDYFLFNKQDKFNVNRLSIPFINLLLVSLIVLSTVGVLPEINSINGVVTVLAILMPFLIRILNFIFSTSKNNLIWDRDTKLRFINLLVYIILSILFYLSVLDMLIFVYGE